MSLIFDLSPAMGASPIVAGVPMFGLLLHNCIPNLYPTQGSSCGGGEAELSIHSLNGLPFEVHSGHAYVRSAGGNSLGGLNCQGM